MSIWTLSIADGTGEPQPVGFAHSPEDATALAATHLLDRDQDLDDFLPWRKIGEHRWRILADDTILILQRA